MKVTPKQLRLHIEAMKTERLILRHDIESCEFELEYAVCPECKSRLVEDLAYMKEIDKRISVDWTREIESLEERLAEDETLNGWQGDDRFIEF